MKKLLTPLLLLCAVVVSIAQSLPSRCGTFDLVKSREAQSPGYRARVDACFENARTLAQRNKSNRSANDTIYKVQMVFHILYGSAAHNIDDSIIHSQVEILNEDYRRRNADTVQTRDIFKPFAADARIEFELATIDPDGNPTTGITRTFGAPALGLYSPGSENMKFDSIGGKNAWPTDRYLNVWVCDLFWGIGVLGYATPPSNAPNWDPVSLDKDSAIQGVVLHYPVVGRNYPSPILPEVARGRSLVHELGHYFGLRHIWGDSTACNNNDGMDDTPAALEAQMQTCDSSVNSCVDSPIDYPDMLENYMDYSDDRCVNIFTHDQVGLMRSMLQTSRAGIAKLEIISGMAAAEPGIERIELFPNPATGMIRINAQTKNDAPYSYEIFNSLGDKMISAETLYGSHTLDLTARPAGIYFAKFHSDGRTAMRKFSLVK